MFPYTHACTRNKRVCHMYQYTIPSPISEKDITKLAQKFVGKKKCQIILLWVPYQTLECTIQTFEGTIENTKTALNIMFREDYLSERDLILMFRPNFLKYPKIDHKPSNLNKFLRRLSEKEVQSEEINYETLAKKITFFSETIQKEFLTL